ncbi:MAG: hypothetical protein RIE31_00460 [Alphaproteobacteria bacterium]
MSALRGQRPARPDILETSIANMLVEGHKAGQLDDAQEQAFTHLPQTFLRIFTADPYNPARYRDFYNYLHAAVTETDDTYFVHPRSYAVIDLARALPDRRMPAIISSFTEQEARIAADFPLHFPAYGAPASGGAAGGTTGSGR